MKLLLYILIISTFHLFFGCKSKQIEDHSKAIIIENQSKKIISDGLNETYSTYIHNQISDFEDQNLKLNKQILFSSNDSIYYKTTLKSLPCDLLDSMSLFYKNESSESDYFELDSIELLYKNKSKQLLLFEYHPFCINNYNILEYLVCFKHLNSDDYLDLFISNIMGGNGQYLGEVFIFDPKSNSFLNDSLLSSTSYLEYNKKNNTYCDHGRSSCCTYTYEMFKVNNNKIKILEKLQIENDKVGHRIRIHEKKGKITKKVFPKDYELELLDSLTMYFINFKSTECQTINK